MWPFSKNPKVFTGRTRTAAELRAALGPMGYFAQCGKQVYAEASSKAIIWLAQQARDALWRDGISKWRPDATCTLFAAKFSVNSGEIFFNQAFHDKISEQVLALAVGEVWFHPDMAPAGQNHAIGVALTEIGALYIDPQDPDRLRLMSDSELASITSSRFL